MTFVKIAKIRYKVFGIDRALSICFICFGPE